MKIKKYVGMFGACLFLMIGNVLSVSAYTNIGESAAEEVWNVDDIKWDFGESAASVIVYVYVENAKTTYPKVTINCGDFYAECISYEYVNTPRFYESDVICKMFYLPEGTYTIIPSCDKFNAVNGSYKMINNAGKITTQGKMELKNEGQNEIYIVYGSREWVEENGETKLQEMYGKYSIKEEEADPLQGVVDLFLENEEIDEVVVEGKTYTRYEMVEKGYAELKRSQETESDDTETKEEQLPVKETKDTEKADAGLAVVIIGIVTIVVAIGIFVFIHRADIKEKAGD